MSGIEKAINRKCSKEEERYGMGSGELYYLLDRFREEPYSLIIAAFNYGFEKGKRCEKARQKRAAEEERYAITPKGLDCLEDIKKRPAPTPAKAKG